MLRRILAAATALVAAAALALVASPALADPPADQSNAPSYWQTPDTGEVCAKIENPGGTTWSLPAPPADSVWTKVVIKSGSEASVEFPNNAYVDDLTYKHPADAPGTTWNVVGSLSSTVFSHPSGKDVSHVIYCWAPIPPTEVSGSASATAQTCVAGDLVGGVITVVITTGVTYTITGPSGAVAFDAVTGMTAPLPPGDYAVAVAASGPDYVLTGPSSIPLTISPYDGKCGEEEPIEVTPDATVTDETCVGEVMLVGGMITVDIVEGISYTITGPDGVVAYDPVTGETAELAPGQYTVDPEALPGYELTSEADIPLTVGEYEGPCGLDTKPLVVPAATSKAITCEAPGTITLSSDLVEVELDVQAFTMQAFQPVQLLATGGVIWTINGVETPEGTYSVPGPGVYHVHAEANGPDYGFPPNIQQDWTFTFTDPGTCDLPTLALTGADGSAAVAALAAGLGLLGAALIRTGGRRARRVA